MSAPLCRRQHALLVVVAVILALAGLAFGGRRADAATPLNIYVGYMDTHSQATSAKQPTPWPYTDPTSYVGSPCSSFGNSTTCWDAAAVRLDNPGSADVTGVHPVVAIGSQTYDLWGSNLTVKAHGTLVLTETGAQNSTNFDGSDYPPNAYNGGNVASCVNSGAIPDVLITIGGATTKYLDNGQVLNGGGVDNGHCLNGAFVSGRMDESHPWTLIGSSSPTVSSSPQGLSTKAASGSVALSWTTPLSDGGAAITGYNIYRGTSAGGEAATPVATNVAATAYSDNGLVNGVTYYYKVTAVNSAGESAPSTEASATPQVVTATPPSAPQTLAASAGNGTATLNWLAPTSTGGSPITGYNVYRGIAPGAEVSTPIASNVTALTFTDNTVSNGTTYYYKVAAVNAVGVSPMSNEVTAAPAATVPGAPTGLIASGSSGVVTLSWTAPNSDGGAGITGYNVYRGTTTGGEATTPVATGIAVANFTDSGLTNGTTYFYRVAAVNSVGTSAPSNEASATPQPAIAPPTPPQNLAATGANGAVQLTWSAPSSNGGAAVTGYTVFRGTTPGGEASTPIASNVTSLNYADTGLPNGTTYYYEVSAVNAAGTSLPSAEASAAPHATAPTAPLTPTATGANAAVALAWSAPASDGGAPVTGYNVYRGTSPGGEAATPVATGIGTTSFTDTGLTNATTYYYQVAAVNSVGVSVKSAEISATPQAPVTAGFVRRAGSVAVAGARTTTTIPVGTGGIVGGHTVVASLLLSSTAPIAGAVTVSDSAGNSYQVLRDVNDGASGDRSLVIAAINVKAVSSTGSITFSYPSAGETHVSVDEFAGVTGLDTSAGASATASAFSSGATPVTAQPSELLIGAVGTESGSSPTWSAGWTALPALAVSSDYLDTAYRLVNATGSYAATGTSGGQWMASIVTLKTGGGQGGPPPPSVPSAPQSLAATAGNSVVTLSWTAPASDGGAPITGYNIYRGTSSGAEAATPMASNVAGTSFSDSTAVNGSTYFYKVAAVNSAGPSPLSNEASGTPQAVVTAPSPPQGLNASAGNATVQLSWTAPASNGGSPITGYNVYRGTSSGAESATPIAVHLQSTSYTDSGLSNGTTYYYQVAAANSAGLSARSAEASATPQLPAAARYVRRIGSATAATSRTTTTIAVTTPVTAGDTVVVSLLLSSTAPIAGTVTATDTAGNSYLHARDVNDGSSGDRTLLLVATNVKAIAAGGSLTLTYPSAGETHLSVDEFAGVTGVDVSAGATASGTSFSSGNTSATTQPTEVLIGVVGAESGSSPAWSAGWTALPSLAVSSDYLSTAYRIVTATGSYAATGTVGGQWMSAIVALKTS